MLIIVMKNIMLFIINLTNYYKPEFESGINLLDKNLNVKWPKKNLLFPKKTVN